MTHPMRVRGLKHRKKHNRQEKQFDAPSTGARIETDTLNCRAQLTVDAPYTDARIVICV